MSESEAEAERKRKRRVERKAHAADQPFRQLCKRCWGLNKTPMCKVQGQIEPIEVMESTEPIWMGTLQSATTRSERCFLCQLVIAVAARVLDMTNAPKRSVKWCMQGKPYVTANDYGHAKTWLRLCIRLENTREDGDEQDGGCKRLVALHAINMDDDRWFGLGGGSERLYSPTATAEWPRKPPSPWYRCGPECAASLGREAYSRLRGRRLREQCDGYLLNQTLQSCECT